MQAWVNGQANGIAFARKFFELQNRLRLLPVPDEVIGYKASGGFGV